MVLRYTDRARKVMALANEEAQRFNHEYIGTEHVLLGLLKEGSGIGATVLKNLKLDMTNIRSSIENLVKPGPEVVQLGKLQLTPRTKNVLEYANSEAVELGHHYLGTEHLLLGLTKVEGNIVPQVLKEYGVTFEQCREDTLNLLGAADDVPKDYLIKEQNWTLPQIPRDKLNLIEFLKLGYEIEKGSSTDEKTVINVFDNDNHNHGFSLAVITYNPKSEPVDYNTVIDYNTNVTGLFKSQLGLAKLLGNNHVLFTEHPSRNVIREQLQQKIEPTLDLIKLIDG